MNTAANLTDRATELEILAEKVLQTKYDSKYIGECVDSSLHAEFRTATLSFIDRIYGKEHSHYTEFEKATNRGAPYGVRMGTGILRAIKGELAGGWLVSMKGLVAAELFTDFIEMAEHLLEKGYKDPAGVVTGSVLEEHLRQLCHKNTIDTVIMDHLGKTRPKKAESLNTDLAKAGIYNNLHQKAVTTWLDLRNNAAHGKYGEYTAKQVENMIQGVTEFLKQNEI